MSAPPPPPPPPDPKAAGSWEAKKAEIRAATARGQPIEGMKAVMQELRGFSAQYQVISFSIDTSNFYSNPAAFGLALKAVGGAAAAEAVARFGEILAERGSIFLTLSQPARALQDLEAAAEMHDGLDSVALDALARAKAQVTEVLIAERREEEARKVPITVLTGFLGSGKTTLLNYILRARHGRKFAVIENEVGQIGIDNQLLDDESTSTRTSETITLLDNGCLCCTVRSDLIGAVKAILNKAETQAANLQAATGAADSGGPPLDGILIETTGLADPGPVCKTFFAEDELRARTRMDGVLTLVDARNFVEQLRRKRSEGAVNESAQQVAFADKLLLNKVDAVDAAELQRAEDEIRGINQVCPITRCSLAQRPEEVALDELLCVKSFSLDRVLEELAAPEPQEPEPAAKRRRTSAPRFCAPAPRPESRHDTGVATCAFTIQGAPLVLERFMQVMNTLRAERAVDLYRYKGAICIKEKSGAVKRAVLQGVHDMCMFEPRGAWPAGEPFKSQIVFIGRDLDPALWGRLLEKAKEGVLDEAG